MPASGAWNLLFGMADTLFVLYAVRELSIGAGALGTIFGTAAIGGLIGSSISTRLGRRGTFGPVLAVAFSLGTLPWLALPALSCPMPLRLVGFSAAYFLVRLGLGLWGVIVSSYRQTVVPAESLGRAGASLRFVSYGLGALGYPLAGFLGKLLGLRPGLWVAALGFAVLLGAVLFVSPLPRIRSLSPTDPGPASGDGRAS